MNVLAVDPGGTTGLATWIGGVHRAWAEPFEAAQVVAHRYLADRGDEKLGLVVFESFTITAQTLRKTRDGAKAIEFIGVARYLTRCFGVEFETQSPADAKSFASDSKLKALGWRCPGPGDHAKDASRLLLLALVRRQLLDPALLVSAS